MDALTAIELRVLGALLEKAVTTPDQYPLTLNAIISASNQKSSRHPVTNLAQGEVQHALRTLEDKLLVSADPNLRGRVEKYIQRFCKPPFGVYDFDDGQYAVLTVLMLRGPATPGELRTRTDRLHKFDDNNAVVDTLRQLEAWSPDPLVTELPKEPNRRDCCWGHLFGEDADELRTQSGSVTHTKAPAAPTTSTPAVSTVKETESNTGSASSSNDSQRIATLEQKVAALETALAELQDALGD